VERGGAISTTIAGHRAQASPGIVLTAFNGVQFALGRTRFFRELRAFLVHPAGKAVFSYPEAL
jgi:hypothetical protein